VILYTVLNWRKAGVVLWVLSAAFVFYIVLGTK
jgi:hypothetical protein